MAEAYYGVPSNIRQTVLTYLPDDFKSIIDKFEKKYQNID